MVIIHDRNTPRIIFANYSIIKAFFYNFTKVTVLFFQRFTKKYYHEN